MIVHCIWHWNIEKSSKYLVVKNSTLGIVKYQTFFSVPCDLIVELRTPVGVLIPYHGVRTSTRACLRGIFSKWLSLSLRLIFRKSRIWVPQNNSLNFNYFQVRSMWAKDPIGCIITIWKASLWLTFMIAEENQIKIDRRKTLKSLVMTIQMKNSRLLTIGR